MEFVDWLTGEIRQSGLSYSEIARRGGISHVRISQVMNGEPPGANFCLGIARGLNLPPEEVMRRAGILPSLPPEVAEEKEVIRIVRELSRQLRRSALAMLRGLAGVTRQSHQSAEEQPKTLKDIAAWKLHQRFEAMPPEYQEQIIKLMDRLETHGKADQIPGSTSLEGHSPEI